MEIADQKAKDCAILLKALDRERFIEQISWVSDILSRNQYKLLSNGIHFRSDADLHFQAEFGVRTTTEKALMLTWLLADITLDPKHRAGNRIDPLPGQPMRRTVALEIKFHYDFSKRRPLNRMIDIFAPKKSDNRI